MATFSPSLTTSLIMACARSEMTISAKQRTRRDAQTAWQVHFTRIVHEQRTVQTMDIVGSAGQWHDNIHYGNCLKVADNTSCSRVGLDLAESDEDSRWTAEVGRAAIQYGCNRVRKKNSPTAPRILAVMLFNFKYTHNSRLGKENKSTHKCGTHTTQWHEELGVGLFHWNSVLNGVSFQFFSCAKFRIKNSNLPLRRKAQKGHWRCVCVCVCVCVEPQKFIRR